MKRVLLSISLLVLLASCTRILPGEFWKKFESKSLKNEISDQGPYGGYEAFYWEDSEQNAFTTKNVIDFATKNSWSFKDSMKLSKSEIEKWKFNGKLFFPLSSEGFAYKDSFYNFQSEFFSLLISSPITVYRFKTNWTIVEPGRAETNDALGYIVLNNEKNQMQVYFLWGE